jgi:hypothetical protein
MFEDDDEDGWEEFNEEDLYDIAFLGSDGIIREFTVVESLYKCIMDIQSKVEDMKDIICQQNLVLDSLEDVRFN